MAGRCGPAMCPAAVCPAAVHPPRFAALPPKFHILAFVCRRAPGPNYNYNPCFRLPQGTWPTGIQAPLMDEGPFECLDYVYVWEAPGFDVK